MIVRTYFDNRQNLSMKIAYERNVQDITYPSQKSLLVTNYVRYPAKRDDPSPPRFFLGEDGFRRNDKVLRRYGVCIIQWVEAGLCCSAILFRFSNFCPVLYFHFSCLQFSESRFLHFGVDITLNKRSLVVHLHVIVLIPGIFIVFLRSYHHIDIIY